MQKECVSMADRKSEAKVKGLDSRELKFPETLYIRDIEDRVFQGIVLECIRNIEGVAPVEGSFISSIFSPSPQEGIKGITIEQNLKEQSVGIRVEVNICYGASIPDKAEELQSKIAEEVTRLTGLHVSSVHVVFKHVISLEESQILSSQTTPVEGKSLREGASGDEYSEEF